MADYQVELGFAIVGLERDVDLLERFGHELEVIAGEMGPATAIESDRYIAELTVHASSPLEAGKLASDLYVEAMNRALAATGDELADGAFKTYEPYFAHLHVDREPALT